MDRNFSQTLTQNKNKKDLKKWMKVFILKYYYKLSDSVRAKLSPGGPSSI